MRERLRYNRAASISEATKDDWPRKIKNIAGDVRESNPGPLAPKARIIPLDQHPLTCDAPSQCRRAVPCTHAGNNQYIRPPNSCSTYPPTPEHNVQYSEVVTSTSTSTSTSTLQELTLVDLLNTSSNYKHNNALLLRTPSPPSTHCTMRINNRAKCRRYMISLAPYCNLNRVMSLCPECSVLSTRWRGQDIASHCCFHVLLVT